jgi:hypothetical protein
VFRKSALAKLITVSGALVFVDILKSANSEAYCAVWKNNQGWRSQPSPTFTKCVTLKPLIKKMF